MSSWILSSRRDVVADAAIAVIAAGGLRALTHRTVDRQAGLPIGSTSNVFRTRDDLLDGVVDRLLAIDLAHLTEFRLSQVLVATEDIPRQLAQFAAHSAPLPSTRARIALLGEAAGNPEIARQLQRGRTHLTQWLGQIAAGVEGVRDDVSPEVLVALMDSAVVSAVIGLPIPAEVLERAFGDLLLNGRLARTGSARSVSAGIES